MRLPFRATKLIIRPGSLVHSVLLVWLALLWLAVNFMAPFLCQEPVAFNFAIHTIQ